jgi:hypothetical protein
MKILMWEVTVKHSKGLPELPALERLENDQLASSAQDCLADLRALSGALTTQTLTLLPTQAALVVAFGLAETRGDPGDIVEIAAIAALGAAVMSTVYALSRVHDDVLWRYVDDNAQRQFVRREARRVRGKGWWVRVGVGLTLVAALLVGLCSSLVFSR